VLAALANRRQNKQIRERIKPLVRRAACRFGRGFSGLAQVPYTSEVPQVLLADSGHPGNLFLCKDLLARSDREAAHIQLHPSMLSIRRWYFRTLLLSNSPSVPLR
jgi:hypothetical protein